MGKKDKNIAVAPLLYTAQAVVAGSGEPVKGLFIAFRLSKEAPGTSKGMTVARVVETPHAEEFKDKRYKAHLEHFKQQQAETVDDPAERFVLGFTDADGYLEPVYAHSNPWRDRFARLEPDSFKFSEGEEYHALYIRHPSADVARAATRLLNGGASGRKDVDFSDTDVWGVVPETWAISKMLGMGGPALQKFTVGKVSGKDGDQLIIPLPSTPEAYVPLRTDSGKGAGEKRWWLYAGMPHETLASVQDQVRELVGLLGALKYPATGDQDMPYSVKEIDEELQKKAPQARTDALIAATRRFHGALQAATARFQEHLSEGKAFRPVDWTLAHGRKQWASEIGTDVTFPKVFAPRMEHGGVVGPFTLSWLRNWNENQWVKPPEHLVSIGNYVLMLARGAFAFNAWSELAKTMGCPYGMSSGHSFRQIMAEGGGGAIKNSIHKTGLASDMTGGRRRTSTEDWPIRFEAEFRRLKPRLSEYKKEYQEAQAKLEKIQAEKEEKKKAAQAEVTKAEQEKAEMPATATPKQVTAADTKIARAKAKLPEIEKQYKAPLADANKAVEKTKKAYEDDRNGVLNDDARLPDRWRLRFRIYGHSTAEVFHPDAATRNQVLMDLRSAIADWAGLPRPVYASGVAGANLTSNASSGSATGLQGGFIAFVRKHYLAGLTDEETSDWLTRQFEPFVRFAEILLSLSDEELIERYYRQTVKQWNVNFYEKDGGSDMPEQYPTDGDEDFPVREWAKSWLNLSAIGHGCQMHRISPHNSDVRDQSWMASREKKVLPPLGIPMKKYLPMAASPGEQDDLVAALEDFTAGETEAPEFAETGATIQVVVPTGKNKETTTIGNALAPEDIRAKFAKDWRRALAVWSKWPNNKKETTPVFTAGAKAAYQPGGAQITLVMNNLDAPRLQRIESVRDTLRSDSFKDQPFVVLESGSIVQEQIAKDGFFTGEELAEAIRAALKKIKEDATATSTRPAEAAGDAAKSHAGDKTAEQKKRSDAKKDPPLKMEDWSILVQPIFTTKTPATRTELQFLPDHIVMVPARENAAHLEWWHFQHNTVKNAADWAELLAECGYSPEVMKTPIEGTLAETAEPIHIGLGYSDDKKELRSRPWPSLAEIAERPSNFDTDRDEQLEEAD